MLLVAVGILQLQKRLRRRKRASIQRGLLAAAQSPNERCMDFVHDQMLDGRRFRILTVVDYWSRERASLEPGFCLSRRCVGKALDPAAEAHFTVLPPLLADSVTFQSVDDAQQSLHCRRLSPISRTDRKGSTAGGHVSESGR